MSMVNIYEREEGTFNENTGDLKVSHTVNARKIKTEKEDDYIKVYKYTNTIFAYKGIPLAYVPAVIEISKYMSYAEKGQIVSFNRLMREQICDTLGIKIARLDQIVRDLKNFDVLRPAGYKGVYAVNPFIVGCGEATKIAELRASFDYDADKIAVQTQRKDLITGKTVAKIITDARSGNPNQTSLFDEGEPDEATN